MTQSTFRGAVSAPQYSGGSKATVTAVVPLEGAYSRAQMKRHELQAKHAAAALGVLLFLVVIGLHPWDHQLKAAGARDTGDGDVLRQLSYSALFLGVFFGLGAYRAPLVALRLPVNVAVVVLWCVCSLAWSIEPGIAARRLALTVMIISTVFMSVRVAGYRKTINVLRWILAATLILNYLSIIFDRDAIHHAGELNDIGLVGDWRGIFLQKNFAGSVCALTILSFIFVRERIPTLVRISVIVGSAYFLYRTHSKTSVGILLLSVGAGCGFMAYNPRFRGLFLPGLIILGALSAGVFLFYGDQLTTMFGRPDALTGRVQIWPALWAYSRDHWMLGSGYGSFWNIGPKSPIFGYSQGWVAKLGNGHNGYMDALIQIGAPGLLLVVAMLIVWPFLSLVGSSTIPRVHGALLLSFLVFCAGHNMTETSLLDRDAILQVVLMITLALVEQDIRGAHAIPPARALLDQRLRRP